MNYVITVTNQKGGTGKTTTTLNMGAGLAQRGYNVLLIDLDPQGSLTLSAGINPLELKYTVYELLKGECKAQDTLQSPQVGNYKIIPADIRLSVAELELAGVAGREQLLAEALEPIASDYDFIFIDTSPSLGVLTLNALAFADEVIIPLQAEPLALAGMASLLQTVKTVNKRLNPNIGITGIVITRYSSRKKLNSYIIDKLSDKFTDKLYDTKIRDNIALAEATQSGTDIFTYDEKSNGAQDYTRLIEEFLHRRAL